jgi:hypothetical protein
MLLLISVKPLPRGDVDNKRMDRTGTFMTLLRRNRKALAASCLTVWLFSFAVGVAHACGVLPAEPGHAKVAFTPHVPEEPTGDSDGDAACAKFCADDLPLVTKLKSVQDQPGGQALVLPPYLELLPARIASAPLLPHRPHPPPAIALNTRFVRLVL